MICLSIFLIPNTVKSEYSYTYFNHTINNNSNITIPGYNVSRIFYNIISSDKITVMQYSHDYHKKNYKYDYICQDQAICIKDYIVPSSDIKYYNTTIIISNHSNNDVYLRGICVIV